MNNIYILRTTKVPAEGFSKNSCIRWIFKEEYWNLKLERAKIQMPLILLYAYQIRADGVVLLSRGMKVIYGGRWGTVNWKLYQIVYAGWVRREGYGVEQVLCVCVWNDFDVVQFGWAVRKKWPGGFLGKKTQRIEEPRGIIAPQGCLGGAETWTTRTAAQRGALETKAFQALSASIQTPKAGRSASKRQQADDHSWAKPRSTCQQWSSELVYSTPINSYVRSVLYVRSYWSNNLLLSCGYEFTMSS